MRSSLVVASIFLALAFTACIGMAEGRIYVKDVTMSLSDGNATFDLNYSLEIFTRLYVLALGCRYIEPDLISLFSNYSNVQIKMADPDRAALLVTGAGRYDSGYYLFDSRPLESKISKFTVVYPEGGQSKTYYNMTATPDVFCRARAFSKLSQAY